MTYLIECVHRLDVIARSLKKQYLGIKEDKKKVAAKA